MAKSYGGLRGCSTPQKVIPSIDTSQPISQQINDLINATLSGSPNRTTEIEIASVEKRIQDFASEKGIKIAGDKIILTRDAIGHTLRQEKQKDGIAITQEELVTFHQRMSSMSVYYDNSKRNFIYFDGNAKYVIEPNKTKGKGKKKKTGAFYITASRADISHFQGSRYTEIK